MMAKIVGLTQIFIYKVRKFNHISILQKGKGVDSHTSPPLPRNPASKTLGPVPRNGLSLTQDLACEQAFSRAGWGEGKAKRPLDRPLEPPFHGTRCASDPDASSYWREH